MRVTVEHCISDLEYFTM